MKFALFLPKLGMLAVLMVVSAQFSSALEVVSKPSHSYHSFLVGLDVLDKDKIDIDLKLFPELPLLVKPKQPYHVTLVYVETKASASLDEKKEAMKTLDALITPFIKNYIEKTGLQNISYPIEDLSIHNAGGTIALETTEKSQILIHDFQKALYERIDQIIYEEKLQSVLKLSSDSNPYYFSVHMTVHRKYPPIEEISSLLKTMQDRIRDLNKHKMEFVTLDRVFLIY